MMPFFGRALAGDHGGIFLMAVLDDFEEVFSFGIAKRGQKQIVEDEDLDLRQFPPMSVSMPVRNMSLPHFRHVKSGC